MGECEFEAMRTLFRKSLSFAPLKKRWKRMPGKKRLSMGNQTADMQGWLNRICERRGCRLWELAMDIGVEESTLRRWKNGIRGVNRCDIAGIYYLSGEGEEGIWRLEEMLGWFGIGRGPSGYSMAQMQRRRGLGPCLSGSILSVGDWLDSLCGYYCITQRELAGYLDVTLSTLWSWRRKKTRITRCRLAGIFYLMAEDRWSFEDLMRMTGLE